MSTALKMEGGDAQSYWPDLEPEPRHDQVDDPDADPDLTDDDRSRPGVPATDPESGA